MSLSTYCLEDGRHLARLHRRRRRGRSYAPTSNTANHDNHEKINLRVSLSFLYGYGAPLGRLPELRYKYALEYNVYHRCLCYFLNQATMALEQEFKRYSLKSLGRYSYRCLIYVYECLNTSLKVCRTWPLVHDTLVIYTSPCNIRDPYFVVFCIL